MARIFLISLGCDKNRIDAEIMAKKLADAGHTFSDDPWESDAALINTCGFIEDSKKEAIDSIFEMLHIRQSEESSLSAVVITGCLAQRYKEELAELIPESDAVTGLGFNADIVRTVENALSGVRTVRFGEPENLPLEGDRILTTPPHTAYVKIAEGCSNKCAYCAIPSIRGAFRSRGRDDIVNEASRLVSRGVKEIILAAQDTTAYGVDFGERDGLYSLLKELVKIDGIWRIRVLYAYPGRITDNLLGIIRENEKIANYLDIPLQHANETVLKRMRRSGDKDSLLKFIKNLRDKVPDLVLRSSFIVGFPGESEEQFSELIDFLREAQIDRAGCFACSVEEGTPAYGMKGQISDEVKASRAERFMDAQTRILEAKQEACAGRVMSAVVEGYDEKRDVYIARTEYDAPEIDTLLYIRARKKIEEGAVVSARIDGAEGCDLYGTLD